MADTLQGLPRMKHRRLIVGARWPTLARNEPAPDQMGETSREIIRLALRVLTTLNDTGSYNPEDAIALRSVAAGLLEFGRPLDELACLVVHRERQALSIAKLTFGTTNHTNAGRGASALHDAD